MRFDSLGWLGETRTKWKKFAKSNILPAELKALHLQITRPCCHYNHLVSPPSPPNSYLYLAGLHTSKNSLKKKKKKDPQQFFKSFCVQRSLLNNEVQSGGEWVIIVFFKRIPTICFVLKLRR